MSHDGAPSAIHARRRRLVYALQAIFAAAFSRRFYNIRIINEGHVNSFFTVFFTTIREKPPFIFFTIHLVRIAFSKKTRSAVDSATADFCNCLRIIIVRLYCRVVSKLYECRERGMNVGRTDAIVAAVYGVQLIDA